MLIGMWSDLAPRTNTKRSVFKRLHNQHDQEDLCDLLLSTIILILKMNKDIHMCSINREESGYGLNLDLLTILH